MGDGEGDICMLGSCRTMLDAFGRLKEPDLSASVLLVDARGEHMPASFLLFKFIASGARWHVLECTTMCRQSRRLVD